MSKNNTILTNQPPRIMALGIHSPYNSTQSIESYYQEFLNLVRSNGAEPNITHFMKIRQVDPGYFLTSGKLEEIAKIVKDNNIEQIVFSEPLSSRQEKNLEEVLNCEVFDRTRLILEIFEKGAHTAEGKIQVRIAMLEHKKARMAGRGVEMSQQWGMLGTRGPGETAKEREKQHVEHLMVALLKDLKQLATHRKTQRKLRLSKNIPHICLIGYTNAGKSTLLNALTNAQVLAEDKLFATLDTTTKELYINKKKIGLISDTVGFIQQLPTALIESFKSTLDELQYAHFLLHVIDVSDPNFESHINVVMGILQELKIDKPMLYIFNKADKVSDIKLLEFMLNKYQPHVIISATSEHEMQPLLKYIYNWKP